MPRIHLWLFLLGTVLLLLSPQAVPQTIASPPVTVAPTATVNKCAVCGKKILMGKRCMTCAAKEEGVLFD